MLEFCLGFLIGFVSAFGTILLWGIWSVRKARKTQEELGKAAEEAQLQVQQAIELRQREIIDNTIDKLNNHANWDDNEE